MNLLSVNQTLIEFKKLNLTIGESKYNELFKQILKLAYLSGNKKDFENLKNIIFKNFYIFKDCNELFIPLHSFLIKYTDKYIKEMERFDIYEITDALYLRINNIKNTSKVYSPQLLASIISIIKDNKGHKDAIEFLISFVTDFFKDNLETLDKYLLEIEYYAKYYRSRTNYNDGKSFKILYKIYLTSDKKNIVIEKVDSSNASVRYLFYKTLAFKETEPFLKLLFKVKAAIAYYEL